MRVSFYATLRSLVGAKHVEFDLPPGATVDTLLHDAATRFPELGKVMWNGDGTLSEYIKVFVDGREIRHLEGTETPVPATAHIDVFPPTAGG